jgi:hypothetical protein
LPQAGVDRNESEREAKLKETLFVVNEEKTVIECIDVRFFAF